MKDPNAGPLTCFSIAIVVCVHSAFLSPVLLWAVERFVNDGVIEAIAAMVKANPDAVLRLSSFLLPSL
jgi:hypothetical protein